MKNFDDEQRVLPIEIKEHEIVMYPPFSTYLKNTYKDRFCKMEITKNGIAKIAISCLSDNEKEELFLILKEYILKTQSLLIDYHLFKTNHIERYL